MRSLMAAMAASFLILFGLSGCGFSAHDPERYVLTGNDKNLFFQTELTVDPGEVDKIVATVKAFSRQHGMDFLLARESLPPGDFNVAANGPSLNIRAIHIASVGDTRVQMFAIVPEKPTEKDKALVAEFVAKLESIEASPAAR